jgi:hypothetical protein
VAGLLLAAAVCVPASAAPSASSVTPDSERDVKAAFLYNFAKFVEWPPGAFADAASPMVLCVLDDEALGASLRTTVKGETLNNHRLMVRLLRDPQATQGCHVLFVGPEKGRLPEILAPLRGSGVLTVGGAADFLDRGGMIRLFLEQNRVRFDINLDAAEHSHLKLSSKLLRLARAVNPQRQEG